jgi:hypothetical protein
MVLQYDSTAVPSFKLNIYLSVNIIRIIKRLFLSFSFM